MKVTFALSSAIQLINGATIQSPLVMYAPLVAAQRNQPMKQKPVSQPNGYVPRYKTIINELDNQII
jgi:hypothetical protein